MSKIRNPITGVTSFKNERIDNKITFLVLVKKLAMFTTEGIHLRLKKSNGQDKNIIDPQPLKNVFPHIATNADNGLMIYKDNTSVAFIQIGDGNIESTADNQLMIDLTELDSTKTYELYAVSTEEKATHLFKYSNGKLDNGAFNTVVNVENYQTFAVERTYTDLILESLVGESQEFDKNEMDYLETFTGALGFKIQLASNQWTTEADAYQLIRVGKQRRVTIKNTLGNAIINYSMKGIQSL